VDFIQSFFSFLFAFIAKDFYDLFIRSHIITWLNKYKEHNETLKKTLKDVFTEDEE